MNDTVERIVAAALRTENPYWGGDLIVSAPPPARHHTLLHGIARIVGQPCHWDQGFLTNSGHYVNREEGYIIARNRRQIITKHGPSDMLFSEDMW